MKQSLGRDRIGSRLIMITGSGPGVGKSTLMRGVVERLEERGCGVLEVCEDSVWGRRELGADAVDVSTASPEFRKLLHRVHRIPSPDDVAGVFEQFSERVSREGLVWVQDWSWLDFAATFGWARSDDATLERFCQDLRRRAVGLDPVVLYLAMDPLPALKRAIAERGVVWFNRHLGAELAEEYSDGRLQLAGAHYRQLERDRLHVLRASGWNLVCIDGGEPPLQVLNAALVPLEMSSHP